MVMLIVSISVSHSDHRSIIAYKEKNVDGDISMQKIKLCGTKWLCCEHPVLPCLTQHRRRYASGIDPLIWEQAKLDNPDPQKLLPIPIIGFSELHKRLKQQDMQTQVHNASLTVSDMWPQQNVHLVAPKYSLSESYSEECSKHSPWKE